MPHANDWEARLVIKRFSGFVTGDEFVRSVEETIGDHRFDDLRFVIEDFSGATDHGIDAKAIDYVAVLSIGSTRTNPNICVLLISNDSRMISFAQAAMRGPYDAAYTIHVFATMALAREWLAAKPQSDALAGRSA